MARSRSASAALLVWPIALLTCVAAPKSASAQPNIDHPGIECIAPGKFAVILSGIEPERDVRTAKVYFRSNLYPDYYYVEMMYGDGRFAGVLPQPSPETTRVIYYLEAIDGVFNGTRSVEWDPLVEDCDDDPAAAYFTGEEASIVVGATTSGQAAIPAGFSAVGIVGTIAATGIASGVGGGVGAGTAVAVGAVAAGAAGAAVVATGPSEEPTTTAAVAAVTSSIPTSSAPASPDPGPGSTSVPAPVSTTSIGSTTTTATGGTSSTGSTSTVPGGTTTTSSSTPTSTTSSSTSTSTASTTSIVTTTIATTTVALPPLNAGCFTIQVLGVCQVLVEATCVNLPVDRYEWVLDVDDRWQRIDISSGPAIVVQNWSSSCDEDDETIRFELTVHRGADSDSATKSIVVPGNDLKTIPDASSSRARFESQLELPVRTRARVVINGASARIVESWEPTVVDAPGPSGKNVVAGTLLGDPAEPGTWGFDFGNEPRFEPGSLRVNRGDVLSIGPKAVVFKLNGRAGESVEFTFELRQ